MAGLECIFIWTLNVIPLLSIIFLLYFFDKYYLKNANVHKTTVIICIFALTFGGSIYTHSYLKENYECRKTDQYREKVINFTYRVYEYSEYDWLKDHCEGYTKFHIISKENNTIIRSRKLSYEANDRIEALECLPKEGNKIIVWGDCDRVYDYYVSFPKSWYICNSV